MKRTLMMTAAMIFTGHVAFAAIDPQQLADSYIAQGYSFVEVKQGPTQTKIEAIKDASLIEAIYDNVSGTIISQEIQPADAEELARTGVEIKMEDKDFVDTDDEDDDQAVDDDEEDDQATDDDDDDNQDADDDNDQDDDDDHGGDDGDDSGDDDGDDHGGNSGHDGGEGSGSDSNGD